MSASQTPFAISGISEPEKIRVLLYANNQMVHAPLNAVLKAGMTSGSNANGDYVRFADGTQICWANSASSIIRGNNTSFDEWTFPAAFISIPVVNLTPIATQTSGAMIVVEISTLKTRFNRSDNNGGDNQPMVQRMAIGRWF